MKTKFLTLHDFVQNGGELQANTMLYKDEYNEDRNHTTYRQLGQYKNVYDARETYFVKIEYKPLSIAEMIKRAVVFSIE